MNQKNFMLACTSLWRIIPISIDSTLQEHFESLATIMIGFYEGQTANRYFFSIFAA